MMAVVTLLAAGCASASAVGSTSAGARVTSAARADAARPFTVTGPIVALGDSYTAGLLLPLAPGSEPFSCLRSTANYPTLVARALHARGDLRDVACDSAGVADMTTAESILGGTNPPQFNALGDNDSLVMLTLSGDDMGFSHVLDKCMLLSLTDPKGAPCQAFYTKGGTDQLAQLIAAETPKMTAVLTQVRARAPRARVLLLGYPDLFPQSGGCWPLVPITNGDIAYLRATELRLNSMLAMAAAATGTTYVNTYGPTIGHDFCRKTGVKDVEGLIPTSLAYSFHPNAKGQSVMAAQVLAALRS